VIKKSSALGKETFLDAVADVQLSNCRLVLVHDKYNMLQRNLCGLTLRGTVPILFLKMSIDLASKNKLPAICSVRANGARFDWLSYPIQEKNAFSKSPSTGD